MSSFFVVLLLISLVLLVWGLISPKSLTKKSKKEASRGQLGIGFGVIAVALFIAIGITAPPVKETADKKVLVANASATKPIAKSSQSNPQPAAAKPAPVATHQTVTETEAVPFTKRTVYSASYYKGTNRVTTAGVDGERTIIYQLTMTDGQQTDKQKIKEEITIDPISQVTTIGTKVKVVKKPAVPKCDSNYSGQCVPIASDVDCGGGSGNGPAYVYGTVKVIGVDIYDLDRDGDGYGCE